LTWRSKLDESLELPDWLGDYLDHCGRHMLGDFVEVERELGPVTRGKGIRFQLSTVTYSLSVPGKLREGPGSIGRALGFKEGLAVARCHWGGQFDKREHLAYAVVNLMWTKGLSLKKAANVFDVNASKVNRTGASAASVMRAVRHAQRFALRLMCDRLRETNGTVPSLAIVPREFSKLCVARGRKFRAEEDQDRRPRLSRRT